ncbi:MAG: hypothetical protein CVV07_07450 [Gammaproteobacteria bacterium HGW-Gammaproteobacteria-11]|nr:MAG: hypothetical protein CVV07_07450 [Gammaproteobacteria bacterium HGW-Gammaproteobacteria-11]
MQPVTTAIQFFPAHELECKGSRKRDASGRGIAGTGVIKMDPRFAQALPVLRGEWGRPLSPNSVCRTPGHNNLPVKQGGAGGHPNSLHLTENPKWPTLGTMGADIQWRSWSTRTKLAFARLAWRLGWAVGLHDGFCHVDRRGDLGLPNLPRAVFLYGTWSGAFSPQDVINA